MCCHFALSLKKILTKIFPIVAPLKGILALFLKLGKKHWTQALLFRQVISFN
jgi:hypothetical protein